MANRGRYKTCFVRQVTNTLNDVKKKVRGYGERGPNRITLKKDGPAWSGREHNERGDSESDDSDGNGGGVPQKIVVRKMVKDEEDDVIEAVSSAKKEKKTVS